MKMHRSSILLGDLLISLSLDVNRLVVDLMAVDHPSVLVHLVVDLIVLAVVLLAAEVQMGNIKVLNLDRWMLDKHDRDSCVKGSKTYTKIKPIVKRNGKYSKDGKAWFEVDGKAWSCDPGQFKWELDTLNASELNSRQVAALQGVCRENMATKEQAKLLYMYGHAQELREIRRGVYYFLISQRSENE